MRCLWLRQWFIAGESYGLGICYLGTTTYMADKLDRVLRLSERGSANYYSYSCYPDESPELTDRLPYEGLVHSEVYKDYSSRKILIIFTERRKHYL